MPSLVAVNRRLRRVAAAVVALSVLLTTLGWAHPVCASPAAHGAPAVAGHHAPSAPAADPCHAAAPADATDRPGGGPDAPLSAPCVAAAHCATAALLTTTTAKVQRVEPASGPDALGEALPPSPTSQPDSPPPKR